MGKELWVRWKMPVVIGKPGRTCHYQIFNDGKGGGPYLTGVLGTLLEHLRYCKRFDYKVEGKFLIVEHPFERGPNVALRKKMHANRAKTYCCTVEYFWRMK